jgi:hypothetical protein
MRRALRGSVLLAALIAITTLTPSAAAQVPPPGYGGGYVDPYYAQYYGGGYADPYYSQYYSGGYPYNGAYNTQYPYSGYNSYYNTPYPSSYNGSYPYNSYPYYNSAYPPGYPYNSAAYPYNTSYPPPALGNPFYAPPGYPPGYPGGGGAFQANAVMTGPTTITLNWTVLPGATNYQILQGLNGAPLTMYTTTTSTSMQIPVSGQNTQYQVNALGPTGQVIAQSNVTGVVPNGPFGPGQYPPQPPYGPYGPYPPQPPYVQPTAYCQIGTGPPGVVSPGCSTIAPAATVVPATQGTTVVVTLLDANRNPVPNVPVTMTPARAGDSAVPTYTNPMSNNQGVVYFTVRGAAPGQATFNTTAGGVNLPPFFITFQ